MWRTPAVHPTIENTPPRVCIHTAGKVGKNRGPLMGSHAGRNMCHIETTVLHRMETTVLPRTGITVLCRLQVTALRMAATKDRPNLLMTTVNKHQHTRSEAATRLTGLLLLSKVEIISRTDR